jgi:hypothetical protein
MVNFDALYFYQFGSVHFTISYLFIPAYFHLCCIENQGIEFLFFFVQFTNYEPEFV